MSYYENKDPDYRPLIIAIFIGLLLLGIISIFIAYGEPEMNQEKELLKRLRLEEGYRSKPYLDTVNRWTLGYGWNVQGRPLTKIEAEHLFGEDEPYPISVDRIIDHYRKEPMSREDAEYILEHCLHIAEGDCQIIFGKFWVSIPTEKRIPLIDMAYNLGIKKFRKFKKMIKAVKESNWSEAAKQIRNSLAYLQAQKRYESIAILLED